MRKILVLFFLSLMTCSIMAQRIRIAGSVVDATHTELPGVTVLEKGTSNGTVTDIDGNFSLTVAGNNSVLVFSFVGFESQEIEVGTQRSLSITLEESSQTLDDVVVVAFGTQKKEEIVGSVSTVRPSELKTPSSNLTTSLAGRMSGVIAYQRSGEPGLDNAEFFIRGVTTFGYKKDPLILIDGIELTSTDLARLNPDDISSFSIMKDATATALYGARGANGVILVTTKEGREGKAKISLRVEGSASMPTRDVELADPVTYMKLNNEAILTRDPLGRILYSDDKIENTVPGSGSYIYPTTDWKEELFKDYAMNQRVNMSVSGGGNIARYFVAGSFNQDNGVLKVDNRNNFNNNIKLRTYSLRSNVNVNVFPTTEMILRISGVFDDYKGPLYGGGDLYTRVMRANPVLFPAYYPKDEDHPFVEHIMFGNYDDGQYLNPYADLVRGYRDNSRSNVNAQIEFKQDLKFVTEGLKARARFNTTRTSFFDLSRNYSPFYYQLESYNTRENSYRVGIIDPDGGTEYLTYNEGDKRVNSTVYVETALDYNRLFADKHNLSGMLVYVLRQQLNGNAGTLQSSLPYRNLGLSGRTTYGFDNRYYAEFNFGYNGSERFYKTHRWGFFPSAGVAWSISNEDFFSGLKKTVDNLRLRATYGLVGNDAIGSGRFLYLSEINPNASGMSAVFGRDNGYQRNGYSVIRYSDNNITWETAKKMNAALEIGLFNKIDIIAEYFTENRYNILQERASTPASMGLWTVPAANIGKASGRGVDVSVDINHYINKDMWIQGRGNFTYATSVYDVYEEYDYTNAPWRSRIGYPISQNWGYIAESLFADDAEVANSPRQFGEYMAGDIKYRDVNGDGVITTLDQVPIGYPTTPEIVYGFGFSYGYKQFDISAFFQGSGRSSFWISPSATAPFVPYHYNDSEQNSGTIFTNQLLKAYADSYWSEEKRDLYALWPRLSTYPIQNNTVSSTWFMRNGSFMRLKQVEMGYTLPENLVKRLGMSDMRLYANATNLFTWSKFKLWDVEMAGNGLRYPIQKVFNVGLTLSY